MAFIKTKPLSQRAEEQREKVELKMGQLEEKRIDRLMQTEKRKRIEEARIPPRLRA